MNGVFEDKDQACHEGLVFGDGALFWQCGMGIMVQCGNYERYLSLFPLISSVWVFGVPISRFCAKAKQQCNHTSQNHVSSLRNNMLTRDGGGGDPISPHHLSLAIAILIY